MSVLTINLRNVEELIFQNKSLRRKLPEFQGYFQQWEFAKQHSSLKSMGKQAILDLLYNLNEAQILILEENFKTSVTIDKLSNRIVRNYQFSVEELEDKLNGLTDQSGQVAAYRENEQVYISCWR